MVSESTLPESPSAVLAENCKLFDELLGIGISWDIIKKEFDFAGRPMVGYCINGFFLTLNQVIVMEDIANVIREYVEKHNHFNVTELKNYISTRASFVQITSSSKMEDIMRLALSGPIVLFLEGLAEAVIVDTRIYPMRNPSEPEVERVIRGPKDGFTETMLINTALVRRRLRDPKLRVELFQVGKRSKTDVSLMYIDDITNPDWLKMIRKQLKAVDVDGVPMGEGALTDYLTDQKWQWNIYPSIRLTERPDVVATSLLEGQAVIILDTTPEAMILPCVFFQHIHHPEDYHQSPFAGTYMRWALLLATFASIFLTPLWLALAGLGPALPDWLTFLHPGTESKIPLTLQLVILEFGIDVFRRAVINTPVPLASAIGIVSAIVFGQLAVKAKLLDIDTLVYGSSAFIAQFATSSLELGSANRVARVFLTIVTGVFSLFHLGWIGLVLGTLFWFIGLLRKRAFGVPYLWPLFPFEWAAFKDIVLRKPSKQHKRRPTIFKPIDPTRK